MDEAPARAWLLAPAGLVVAGLFFLPLGLLFAVSFWSVRSLRLVPDLTLAAYARFLSSYLDVTLRTLGIGLVTGLLCTVLGFVFAYGARFDAGRFADALVLATLVTLFGGYLAKVYAWRSILGIDGIVNSLLLGLGIVREPVAWMMFNRGTVIVALLHFLLPFAILPIYASLRTVSLVGIEAARDLGAGSAAVLRRVILPQCRGGIAGAFAFCFLLASGDYVTPLFLGGSSGSMLGQFITVEFSTRFNWPAGAAMAFALLGACLVTVAGARTMIDRVLR
jgi:spermidine/putrescine transport system permease protein